MKFILAFSSFMPLYILGAAYLLPDAISYPKKVAELSVLSAYALTAMTIVSIICLMAFRASFLFKANWAGNKVVSATLRSGNALSFYSAILVPLVTLCQIAKIGEALCFWLSLILSFALVIADEAYLSNPILVLFGLRAYDIEYEREESAKEPFLTSAVVLTRRPLSTGDVVSGKRIDASNYLVFNERSTRK